MGFHGYGDDPKDLAKALRNMAQDSVEATQGKGLNPQAHMREHIRRDRRFDSYDPARLAKHVWDRRGIPHNLELDDPYLRKGGARRPGDPEREWQ